MESLFFVGQKVVAKITHEQKRFIKGQIFKVLDIKQACCHVIIRIGGEHNELGVMECTSCGTLIPSGGGFYYKQNSFAPVQEIGSMTYEDAISLVSTKFLQA